MCCGSPPSGAGPAATPPARSWTASCASCSTGSRPADRLLYPIDVTSQGFYPLRCHIDRNQGWRLAGRSETCSTFVRHAGSRGRTMIGDFFRVDGRSAVVTGAGRGLGAAAAVALAEAGADVVISARSEEQLAKVAQEIEAAGRRAVVVPADLSDLDAVAGLAEAAVSAFGRLDMVVNNVGGAMPRPFLDTAPRHLSRAFEFNVATAHSLTRAAVPHLLAATENGTTSAVINITSTVGRVA